ncbi:MAG TPA: hypothetical protein VG370_23650 [Chloroflexota bacterium]|jgi:hypothetical protein|nr:hypothetical protein [Chloroflexota bacterium]
MKPFERCIREAAYSLSDEQLRCELDCARRCALQSTRARRELALLRARCLRLELERRALRGSAVLASHPGRTVPA